ncbi:MAG: T9SS type A sorting domain-containing protein [Bacteroidota bacterium]
MRITLLASLLMLAGTSLQAQSWMLQQSLPPLDTNLKAQDQFGFSVALTDSFMIVGSPQHEYDLAGDNRIFASGAAFVYKRSPQGQWQQTQKLVAPTRAGVAFYGNSVAINEDWIIVSAYQGPNDSINNTGEVYCYAFDTGSEEWVLDTALSSPQAQLFMQFGRSLSLSDNRLLIGAAGDELDANGQNQIDDAGAAYVYEYVSGQGWTFLQKIVASDRGDNSFFGQTVSLSGDYLCVGAPNHTLDPLTNPLIEGGQVYLFEYNASTLQYEEVQKLRDQTAASLGKYGQDLSLWQDRLMIGKTNESDFDGNFVSRGGAVEYYERQSGGSWQFVQELRPSVQRMDAFFGRVQLQGDIALIGAYGEAYGQDMADSVAGGGAAYIFVRSPQGQWLETDKFAPNDRARFDEFGQVVALSGQDAIVGSPFAAVDSALFDAGKLYAYQRDWPLAIEPQAELSLRLYPNPATEKVVMHWPGYEIESLRISDLQGKNWHFRSLEMRAETIHLHLPDIPAGLYYIVVRSTDGLRQVKRLQIK